MGRTFIANTGTAALPSNASDPAGIAGDLHFNSAEGRLKLFSTTWQPVGALAVISGKMIHVDINSPNATDIRTGISLTSVTQPFQTINAAAQAISSLDAIQDNPYVIVINSGNYYETVLGRYLYLVFSPGAWLFGRVEVTHALTIIGASGFDSYNNGGPTGMARVSGIVNNDANPAVVMAGGNSDNVRPNLIQDMLIQNTFAGGIGVYSPARAVVLIGCTVLADAHACYASGSGQTHIENCYLVSYTSGPCVHNTGEATYIQRSVIRLQSLETAPAITAIADYGTSQYWIENSSIYCANSGGVFGQANAGFNVFRNNYFNTFREAMNCTGNPNRPSPLIEITGNIINVRGGTANSFIVRISDGMATPPAPVVMNNRLNSAGFDVYCSGATVLSDNNSFSLSFPAGYPYI